ncbi:MAG TPA: putative glycoside hydrolase [Egibacteraceae bacterium]|nr:putative glycoside hydrolase [Egibacteraceae bacterium]
MVTRTRLTRRGYVVLGSLPAFLVAGMLQGASAGRIEISADGPPANVLVDAEGAAALAFRARVTPAERLDRVRLTLDGDDVLDRAELEADGETLVYRPQGAGDGVHRVEVRVDRGLGLPDARARWTFEVDTAPPRLRLAAVPDEIPIDQPVEIAGAVDGEAVVTVGGQPVQLRDGGFSVSYPMPPPGPVQVVATDPAGNQTTADVPITVAIPEVRGVHVTAAAWATPSLRDPILRMIEEGRITAVELDIKDESGVVGYDSQVPLAREIGAVKALYDLGETVRTLHDLGVRVIGRLVCFRDPVHAEAAWEAGERDQVIQTPAGGPYADYGGFTNFAHPQVRAYQIDLAEEAAAAGFDEILYDYVRRPDGPLETMVFPGLQGTPEAAIASFLGETRQRLRARRALLGASVFGIAATRPLEIAQDIPAMARHVDYIAPMLYPSHWRRGEYDVADPNGQPYDIVFRSLQDFQSAVAGSDTRIVPWLQDFSLGRAYGPDQVRAQIQAARDVGIDEWLLWDPKVTYTAAALERR